MWADKKSKKAATLFRELYNPKKKKNSQITALLSITSKYREC